MQRMPATLIRRDKVHRPDGLVIEVVIWAVQPPVPGSGHGFKYRLYAGRGGSTLLRYDNEAGKGDHKHVGADELEVPTTFVSMGQTLRDFLREVDALAAYQQGEGP